MNKLKKWGKSALLVLIALNSIGLLVTVLIFLPGIIDYIDNYITLIRDSGSSGISIFLVGLVPLYIVVNTMIIAPLAVIKAFIKYAGNPSKQLMAIMWDLPEIKSAVLKSIGVRVEDEIGTAYKIIDSKGAGIYYQSKKLDYINSDNFEVKTNSDINTLCSYGVSLGTKDWCLKTIHNINNPRIKFLKFIARFNNISEPAFVVEISFNVKDAVIPVNTDGKFRVSKCQKTGIVPVSEFIKDGGK